MVNFVQTPYVEDIRGSFRSSRARGSQNTSKIQPCSPFPTSPLHSPPSQLELELHDVPVLHAELKELPLERDYREIGDLAVWTVTSAKLGNGVEQLRDGRTDTYWQSDGLQPHLINVQFQKKARMQHLLPLH